MIARALSVVLLTREPKASYDTRAACEKVLPADESKEGKHVCLPDTVDPRGANRK